MKSRVKLLGRRTQRKLITTGVVSILDELTKKLVLSISSERVPLSISNWYLAFSKLLDDARNMLSAFQVQVDAHIFIRGMCLGARVANTSRDNRQP